MENARKDVLGVVCLFLVALGMMVDRYVGPLLVREEVAVTIQGSKGVGCRGYLSVVSRMRWEVAYSDGRYSSSCGAQHYIDDGVLLRCECE
jgi:hypothetical protein